MRIESKPLSYPGSENTEKKGFSGNLPDEILLQIFSYLQRADLGSCSLVSKQWRQIARDDSLRKNSFPQIAFGRKMWADFLGDVGEVPPLPHDIHQILESPCPFWKGKKVAETHILGLFPAKIAGKLLTPNKLKQLVENLQINKDPTQHKVFFPRDFIREFGEKTIKESYWFLMTRELIPQSKGSDYSGQALESEHKGYSLPEFMEAVICQMIERRIHGGYRDEGCMQFDEEGYKLFIEISKQPWVVISSDSSYRPDKKLIGFTPVRRLPYPSKKERQKKCLIQ